jgi:uncharacterized membrane protein
VQHHDPSASSAEPDLVASDGSDDLDLWGPGAWESQLDEVEDAREPSEAVTEIDGSPLGQVAHVESVDQVESRVESQFESTVSTEVTGSTEATGLTEATPAKEPFSRWVFRSHTVPFCLLVQCFLVFTAVFGRLVVRRHDLFASFDYDMGIYDQGVYLLSRGRQFLTTRGMRFLAHHWNPGFVLFTPFYRMGAGPNLLNVTQVVALGAGSFPLFFGVKKLSRNSWLALIIAIIYLLHPSMSFLAWELVHPETLAIPFVLGAWCFAEHERWRWFAVMVFGALIWKEDIALSIAMLGLFIVVPKHRVYGLITFAGAIAYFLAATKLIIPAIGGNAPFYEEFFGSLGKSAPELAKNLLVRPGDFYRAAKANDAAGYSNAIAKPYGYTSLLSPSGVMVGLPQYVINLLVNLEFVHNPIYHYVDLPLVGAAIGMARGIAKRKRTWLKWSLAFVALGFSLTSINESIAPYSNTYESSHYWPERDAATDAYRLALAEIPKDPNVVTSSHYAFVPHLTHRYEAYTFPNPWIPVNWTPGANPYESARDPKRVDYIITDEALMSNDDLALYRKITAAEVGDFEEVFRDGKVAVWKRTSK